VCSLWRRLLHRPVVVAVQQPLQAVQLHPTCQLNSFLVCPCRRVAWCHGAAGFVLLLLRAADVLGDPRGVYRAAAKAAADDIWERGLLRKVGWGAGVSTTLVLTCHTPLMHSDLDEVPFTTHQRQDRPH
jgi:hypothetical protein